MPITKSAKKAARVSIKKQGVNLVYKSKLKKLSTLLRKGDHKNKEEAAKLLIEIYKSADKAAKANVIHENKAARMKSRASKKLSPQK